MNWLRLQLGRQFIEQSVSEQDTRIKWKMFANGPFNSLFSMIKNADVLSNDTVWEIRSKIGICGGRKLTVCHDCMFHKFWGLIKKVMALWSYVCVATRTMHRDGTVSSKNLKTHSNLTKIIYYRMSHLKNHRNCGPPETALKF